MTDYEKYRGKCKEMSEALVAADHSLRLVRGHYYCHTWGEQQHWWTVDADGNVNDPTKDQFPSRGNGEYVEFDGIIPCEHCGEETTEDKAHFYGRFAFCSTQCIMYTVM